MEDDDQRYEIVHDASKGPHEQRVTATCVADTTKSATASVTPASLSVMTWTVSPNLWTIRSTGLCTGPAMVGTSRE